jgi:hypothetical protein
MSLGVYSDLLPLPASRLGGGLKVSFAGNALTRRTLAPNLVTPVRGCNPNVVTSDASGGSRAIARLQLAPAGGGETDGLA